MTQIQNYYITEGNTVRVEEIPLPNRQRREQERLEKERLQRRKRQRMQARMARRQRFQAMCTAVVVLGLSLLCVGYVNLSNNITTHMKQISALQEEVSGQKAQNSAAESRIATAANLKDIRGIALNELGMVYANADQIVYYDMEDNDYMSQYQNIP